MLLGWCVSYFAHLLNTQHKFPAAIYSAVMAFELGLFWFDVVLSIVVLLFGAWRFTIDMLES